MLISFYLHFLTTKSTLKSMDGWFDPSPDREILHISSDHERDFNACFQHLKRHKKIIPIFLYQLFEWARSASEISVVQVVFWRGKCDGKGPVLERIRKFRHFCCSGAKRLCFACKLWRKGTSFGTLRKFRHQGTTCSTEISLAVSQRARLSASPALDNRRGHLFLIFQQFHEDFSPKHTTKILEIRPLCMMAYKYDMFGKSLTILRYKIHDKMAFLFRNDGPKFE